MIQLRALIVSLVGVLSLGSALATPGWIDYSPERFAELQAAGETLVVDVAADWCPTCKAQQPILQELQAEESLRDVAFVRVDFDQHKAFLRNHEIPRQSTILVFDGETEVARSIAETNRDRLRKFVFDAVQAQ